MKDHAENPTDENLSPEADDALGSIERKIVLLSHSYLTNPKQALLHSMTGSLALNTASLNAEFC